MDSESDASAQRGSANFPIVGLGASAGGLEALQRFFDHTPPDTGMAFVVVTHQATGRASLLPELLARRTEMPVVGVEASLSVEPNHVYVSTPGLMVFLEENELHVGEPTAGAQRFHQIDQFFRSLALSRKDMAIGVVLSGTGTDGTLGLKEIHGASGLALVQSEQSAHYAGMPHSALVNLEVDYELPVEEMPAALLDYARRRRAAGPVEEEVASEDALRSIFSFLRARIGHDFSEYKKNTMRRRIERRMNVHRLETYGEYARFLRATPREVERLFQELLIGVTSFFREPRAFDAVRVPLLGLLADRPDDGVFRAWVAGCSTGEEAYSIAILLRECLDELDHRPRVQIFATDLDERAIDAARSGEYAESIAGDVSGRRLQRFFTREEGRYRVRKEIREMIIFAPHNLISDPTFTKLDLLSCRNLLIYLNPEPQARILEMFHYALSPDGLLFLGPSETLGRQHRLFEVEEAKWKVFRRREVSAEEHLGEVRAQGAARGRAPAPPRAPYVPRTQQSAGHLAERLLLKELVPPSALIREGGEIVHIHGRTGRFLEPAPGAQEQANLFNMVREGLDIDLAAAVRQAGGEGEREIVRRRTRVRTNGGWTTTDLRVRKLAEPPALRGLFLISFENASPAGEEEETRAPEAEPASGDQTAERIGELERELKATREVHQSTVEQLETSNEEYVSANEELQSTNEELQSTNEELETSKEELQSLNEELQTVNAELEAKLEELSRTNDDMKNLLGSTDIATVFLDGDFRITRYTEQAKKLVRLIPSDVGRPLGDLVSRLRTERQILDEAHEVLRDLRYREAEVQTQEGAWYLMRILPYRTTEDRIDGLVITFIDITGLKSLQNVQERIVRALQASPTFVFRQDRDLRYEWTGGSAFGVAPEEVPGKTERELLSREAADRLTAFKKQALESGESASVELQLTVNGSDRTYALYVEPTRDVDGELDGLDGVATELTQRDRLQIEVES